ncbi:MAG: hypothetical protein ACJ790_01525 [Myxococcaceae bacterium]
MRSWVLIAMLALTGCHKPTAPNETPPMQTAPKKEAVSVADSGTARVGCRDSPRTVTADAGLEAFEGFSGDEKQFAFSSYSEGAGASLLTVIEAPNKMVNRITLGGDKDEIEATKLINAGKFDAAGYVSDFDFKLEGTAVHVFSHGVELWKGEPFGAQGAGNVRIEPWGCSRSRTHGAIAATVSSGTEFGDIHTFVIFELPEAR